MNTFNVNATSLNISFECPSCSEKNCEEVVELPKGNYTIDTIRDSLNTNEEFIECGNCGKSFRVELSVNNADGELQLIDEESEDEVDVEIKEIYDEESDEDYN